MSFWRRQYNGIGMSRSYFYHECAQTLPRDDFWGQVKRTVNGKPVSQEQIDMIVRAVRSGLGFVPDDILLDLGCGNGALSPYFFPDVQQFLGIDLCSYLIDVAKEYFEKCPDFLFMESDLVSYLAKEGQPNRFTKCLCYGAFSYLPYDDARTVLKCLLEHFRNVKTVFIGNLPDRSRVGSFYLEKDDFSELLDDNDSPIGIWRSKEEFTSLAVETGWGIEFRTMPDSYYAAHYRYDVILRRHG